jgi:hypothetical protein
MSRVTLPPWFPLGYSPCACLYMHRIYAHFLLITCVHSRRLATGTCIHTHTHTHIHTQAQQYQIVGSRTIKPTVVELDIEPQFTRMPTNRPATARIVNTRRPSTARAARQTDQPLAVSASKYPHDFGAKITNLGANKLALDLSSRESSRRASLTPEAHNRHISSPSGRANNYYELAGDSGEALMADNEVQNRPVSPASTNDGNENHALDAAYAEFDHQAGSSATCGYVPGKVFTDDSRAHNKVAHAHANVTHFHAQGASSQPLPQNRRDKDRPAHVVPDMSTPTEHVRGSPRDKRAHRPASALAYSSAMHASSPSGLSGTLTPMAAANRPSSASLMSASSFKSCDKAVSGSEFSGPTSAVASVKGDAAKRREKKSREKAMVDFTPAWLVQVHVFMRACMCAYVCVCMCLDTLTCALRLAC